MRIPFLVPYSLFLASICWSSPRQTKPTAAITPIQITSDDQDWLARARATADDPKKARAVILDGQFGTARPIMIHIAQAYQRAYLEKKTPQRLACFAYAAETAKLYAYYMTQQSGELEISAMEAMFGYPANIEPGQRLLEFQVGKQYKLSPQDKSPEDWLAYGMFFVSRQDFKHAIPAIQKAITLDPHFGEAWYSMANMVYEPYHGPQPPEQVRHVIRDLDRAEKEVPRLHFLTNIVRGTIAESQGDWLTELHLLREQVALVPNNYGTPFLRKRIAAIEKEHPGN